MAQLRTANSVHLPTEVSDVVILAQSFPEDWDFYIGWPELDTQAPDLLLVSPERKLLFVSASGANLAVLDAWSPEEITANAPLPARRLARAVRALLASPDSGKIARVLVLTNVVTADIALTFVPKLPPGIACLPSEEFTPAGLERILHPVLFDPELLPKARAHIAPPSVVTAGSIAQQFDPAEFHPLRFLDPVQEDWLRRNLPLDPVEARLPGGSGAYLLGGPAGSGKSLLLVNRALVERMLQPSTSIALLTHNKPLAIELQVRATDTARRLGAPPLMVATFLAWCRKWADRFWQTCVTYDERERYVAEAVGGSRDAIKFHAEEFAYIQDHDIASELEYLEFPRAGRVRPLQREQRQRIWRALGRYLALLEQRQVTDFPTLTRRLYLAVREGRLHPPKFAGLFVDEAQFFSPTAIGILKHATTDGRLVLAADPTQGFLQRRSPWTRVGLNLSGRSSRLTRPYRSTQEILLFARAFYEQRTEERDPDLHLPLNQEIALAPSGAWPEIVVVERLQDELARAADTVKALIAQRVAPRDILILSIQPSTERSILSVLRQTGAGWTASPAQESGESNQVRTSTLQRATGLEASYVILLGLRRLFEEEQNPLQPEREQFLADNTRLLYMAFTRAGHRLLIIWSGSDQPPLPRPLSLP